MSFAAVLGQERAIAQLRQAVTSHRLAHAYLLCGPQGVGKFLAAREFAKMLNCDAPGPHGPCDACDHCRKADKGFHPDIFSIDEGDEEIKIERIRELQRHLSLRPYEGSRKVCLVNNCHRLGIAAAHAFLKTLEEPSGSSVLILVTDKPGRLLRTITSRCQSVGFTPLPRETLRAMLQERFGITEASAHFLAYYCEGRIGSALGMNREGVLDEKNRALDMLIAPQKALVVSDKEELVFLCNMAASWLRDVSYLRAGYDGNELIHRDRAVQLRGYAQGISSRRLAQALEACAKSLEYLEHNINAKLVVSYLQQLYMRGA